MSNYNEVDDEEEEGLQHAMVIVFKIVGSGWHTYQSTKILVGTPTKVPQ